MKKLSALLLCIISFQGYAAVPQYLNVIHDYTQRIYLTYAHLQGLQESQLLVNPITCTFTTQYSGKIYVGLAYQHQYKVITVSYNKSYIQTFNGFFANPSVIITNMSCNSGFDGDKCISATQTINDASVVVRCS